MKRFALISIVAAAMLFVGCEKKEQAAHNAEQKEVAVKEAPKAQNTVKSSVAAHAKKEEKIAEPLPGMPVQKSSAAAHSSVAATAEQKVQEVKKEVVNKVAEVATEAKEKVKEAVAAALPGAGIAGAAAATTKEATTNEATTQAETKGGDVAKGKELFAKCASCHGSDGKRKALGKSGVIAGMPKDEVAKKLKEYKAGNLNLYGMGALMKSQVATLSDSDIEALAAYISSLK